MCQQSSHGISVLPTSFFTLCVRLTVNTANLLFTVEECKTSFTTFVLQENSFLLLILVLYSAYLLIKHFKVPVQWMLHMK